MALTLEVKGHSFLYKGITYQSPRMSTTMFLKNHISVFSHNSINPNPFEIVACGSNIKEKITWEVTIIVIIKKKNLKGNGELP